jgi:FAD/FMN-containing dehydrogenase
MSLVSLELYSTAKARAVLADTNAVGPAIRTERFHCFFGAVHSSPELDVEARRIGDMLRAALHGDGKRGNVYANFSVGDETAEQLYGDGERLERLKELKAQYDPKGLFSQFVPIS